jgi:hypothetical protein
MTNSDDPRPEQPAEVPQESQRSLPHLLGQLAGQAADGSVKGAAGYAAVKGMQKVFGGRGRDEGAGPPEPPADQPPSQAAE